MIAAVLLAASGPSEKKLKPWAPAARVDLDGDFALVTTSVLVPSSCYVGAGTVEAPPAGRRVPDELAPLQLIVKASPGSPCKPSPTVLRHRHEKLDLRGKVGVLIFVVLDGKIVGEVESLFR